jgi:GAF domain-containing protein
MSSNVVRMHSARSRTAEQSAPASTWLSEFMHELGPIQEARDFPDVYAGLARSVVGAVGADACLVSILEQDRTVLRDVAASGRESKRLNVVAASYRLDDFPVTRDVIENGLPVEISMSDPTAHPSETQFLVDLDFRRVLICPLVVAGSIIGTLEAYRSDDRPFDADDPRQIGLIASFAGSAHARIALASELDTHYTATIAALASALEARDPETNAHTGRIKDFAVAVAEAMQVPADVRRAVRLGALLHDVGKIGIRDSILLKKGSLSHEEWLVMKTHPALGEQMLREVEFLKPALPIIRHHHERWDGSGYPDGLSGADIPLGARIVAVCDAFDAMTSDRPYRRALPIGVALEELLACSGTQFDPDCARLLVDVVRSLGDRDLEGAFVRYSG